MLLGEDYVVLILGPLDAYHLQKMPSFKLVYFSICINKKTNLIQLLLFFYSR